MRYFVIENDDNKQKMGMLHDIDARSFLFIIGHVCHVQEINRNLFLKNHWSFVKLYQTIKEALWVKKNIHADK